MRKTTQQMIRKYAPAIFCMSMGAAVSAQAPAITMQNVIGGNNYEQFHALDQAADGGYILGGWSVSDMSGDVSEEAPISGMPHLWIVKTNAAGVVEWDNTIGSDGEDDIGNIACTSDGGFILGAFTYGGVFGDKTDPGAGGYDFWVMKLDNTGAITWQNAIGGTGDEFLFPALQTTDGGYIVGGYSNSGIGGDKTMASFGGHDYWVVKLDNTGNITWQAAYGGAGNDYLYSMKQTTDGGYILGGYSNSGISGNKTEDAVGGYDYWIVKINSTGTIEWQNVIGGPSNDNIRSIDLTTDGGYVAGGWSNSGIGGDKTEACIGANDYWVVKLNSGGTIAWENTIGGTGNETLNAVEGTTDGGIIVGGYSNSGISGDKSEAPDGAEDFWIVKLNSAGSIQWQSTLGSALGGDYLYDIMQTSDGGYAMSGATPGGISGDVNEVGIGEGDYWLVKLATDGAGEICNGIDDNGNGIIDEGLPVYTYWADVDADGYGSDIDFVETCADTPPYSYSVYDTDCSPYDGNVHPGATEICDDIDNNCNGTVDEGFPVYTYWADVDGDGYGSDIDFTQTCSETPPYSYSVYDTDCSPYYGNIYPGAPEICDGVDNDCDGLIDEDPVSITISAGGATTFCQGGSVVLTATYTGTTLQWKKNGSNIPGATNATYAATVSGSYTCKTNSACGNATSTGITVTVNKAPNASITAGGPTTFCPGSSVVLTANTGAGLSYQWYKGTNAISGATTYTYTATVSGNYKCRVTKNATGCYKNSNIITVTVSCRENGASIAENVEPVFECYPNPVTAQVMIQTFTSEEKTIIITDVLGNIVATQNTDNEIITFDLQKVAAGTYTVTIITARGKASSILVKQ